MTVIGDGDALFIVERSCLGARLVLIDQQVP